jgi:hypothetical protein
MSARGSGGGNFYLVFVGKTAKLDNFVPYLMRFKFTKSVVDSFFANQPFKETLSLTI